MSDESGGRMTVRNTNYQTCAVCGQVRDAERQEEEGREMSLLGAHPYACCPSCGRQVPRPWMKDYIARWRRYGRRRGSEREEVPDTVPDPDPDTMPVRPFPWALVNDDGQTVYVAITVKGKQYVVRWYQGENAEAEVASDSWDAAVEHANHFRTHLLRQGFRDQE